MIADITAPSWMILIAPIPPVIITWFLTRRKIKEVHVLVNSGMQAVLQEVKNLLADNIRLRDKTGEPVSQAERDKASE